MRRGVPGEHGVAAGLPEAPGALPVREHAAHGGSQDLGGVRLVEDPAPGLFYQLGEAPRPRLHHRDPARHRFQEERTEGLPPGHRDRKRGERGEEPRPVLPAKGAEEVRAGGEAVARE